MRVPALLGLLACAGCNEFWGLDPSRLHDADTRDADPNFPRVQLTAQIATTKPDTGAFEPMLQYPPIAPAPVVQIGPLDPAMGPLVDAKYEADGTVQIPKELFERGPWRFVYTIDGATREVHWQPPDTLIGHIVESVFGRIERAPVPAGGGYLITPPNLAMNFQHQLTRVFTTGSWTEGEFVTVPNGRSLDYDFGAKAISMSGPLGAPENARSDHGILVDFRFDGAAPNQCRVSTGTAMFEVPDMIAGARTEPNPQPEYVGASRAVTLNGLSSGLYGRLGTALGGRNVAPASIRWRYGYFPSLAAFGFSKHDSAVFSLPGPQMIALTECKFVVGGERLVTPSHADPDDLRDRFPRIVHVEIINSREVNGVALPSALSAVLTSSSDTFTADFSVAAVTGIEVRRGGTKIADLGADPDGATLPAGTGLLVLAFSTESTGSVDVDSFEITLHAVGAQLEKKRVFVTTARELTIDPSVLEPAAEYVFEIRSYRGRPGAERGDFTTNSYPQYAATIFTRTFRTP